MKCPVCRAAFRGTALCSRCGADLTRLMTLAVRAWRLRQESRAALLAGDFARVRRLAAAAQQIRFTGAGRSLEVVASALL